MHTTNALASISWGAKSGGNTEDTHHAPFCFNGRGFFSGNQFGGAKATTFLYIHPTLSGHPAPQLSAIVDPETVSQPQMHAFYLQGL